MLIIGFGFFSLQILLSGIKFKIVLCLLSVGEHEFRRISLWPLFKNSFYGTLH